MAMSDKRPHTAWLGERQRPAVVSRTGLGVEPVGMGCDLTEQMKRMGREPGVPGRACHRAIAQAPRGVELAEPQARMTQHVIVPGAPPDDTVRRMTVEELLAFADSIQSIARLSELRQRPGGEGNPSGKHENDILFTRDRDGALARQADLRPFALEETKHARREAGDTDGERVLGRRGEAGPLELLLAGLGESAELRPRPDEPQPIENRGWRAEPQ